MFSSGRALKRQNQHNLLWFSHKFIVWWPLWWVQFNMTIMDLNICLVGFKLDNDSKKHNMTWHLHLCNAHVGADSPLTQWRNTFMFTAVIPKLCWYKSQEKQALASFSYNKNYPYTIWTGSSYAVNHVDVLIYNSWKNCPTNHKLQASSGR